MIWSSPRRALLSRGFQSTVLRSRLSRSRSFSSRPTACQAPTTAGCIHLSATGSGDRTVRTSPASYGTTPMGGRLEMPPLFCGEAARSDLPLRLTQTKKRDAGDAGRCRTDETTPNEQKQRRIWGLFRLSHIVWGRWTSSMFAPLRSRLTVALPQG
jgi:hypothetical protein